MSPVVIWLWMGVPPPPPPMSLAELRDGAGRIEGRLVREDADGIEVATDGGAPARRIRWDEIRTLVAEPAPPERARRLACGEWIWRGRSRLSRGDASAAREAFQRAASLTEPAALILSLLAAEGGARAGVLKPGGWPDTIGSALTASLLRARRKPVPPWFDGPDPVDEKSGLILSLPPAWISPSSARRAEAGMKAAAEEARRRGDGEMAALLEIGAAIAAADAETSRGQAPGSRPAPRPAAVSAPAPAFLPGWRILALWAESVSPDPIARARGREAIKALPPSDSRAFRAWAIYAEARSLTLESDPKLVRLGAGRLVLVPAAYALDCPALAEAALAQAARALERLRDAESAAALKSRMTLVPRDMESEQGEDT